MEKVEVLRKKYPKFVYQGYAYKIFKNDLKISFDFFLQSPGRRMISSAIRFKPEIIIKNIPARFAKRNRVGNRILNNFIFHLGLMEIPSYWKATCSPIIEIKAGYLNKNQIKWWKNFILDGMGQFFYENQIDFTKANFLKIISKFSGEQFSSNFGENSSPLSLLKNNFLIPMGEGKDSIVTLELLKKKYNNINCFIVNPRKNHFKILKIAKINNPIIVERKIDPLLLKLNQTGFLNGHTPITAVISNSAVFAAFLFGYKNVVMSCERSANEGNVKYLGKMINHQWSKSFEFETKFIYYIRKYLTRDINYFSFLRPLYEIQIAKIFSQFPQYFPVFLSCNEARKTKSGTKKPTGKWCGKCLKCLFIWTIFYPFTKERKLVKIFGSNLFEKKELLPVMKELIGERGHCKPLECLGTKKETLIAFYLSYKTKQEEMKQERFSFHLPVLLAYFEKKILPKYPNIERQSKNILNSWNRSNYLSEGLAKVVLNHLGGVD